MRFIQHYFFKELAFNFSDILTLPQEMVLESLKKLQLNALEKLSSRSQFQETGLATVRVKLIGSDRELQIITINLYQTGESLRDVIISTMKLDPTLRFLFIFYLIVILLLKNNILVF